MANDLNFDELDKAVTNYMQKPTRRTVSVPPRAAPIPLSRRDAPSTTAAPVVHPVSSPTHSAQKVPTSVVTPQTPQVQVRSRQTLAGRHSASGTFHDIMPAHRRATVGPAGKRLQPLGDPVSLSKVGTDIAPPPPSIKPSEVPTSAAVPEAHSSLQSAAPVESPSIPAEMPLPQEPSVPSSEPKILEEKPDKVSTPDIDSETPLSQPSDDSAGKAAVPPQSPSDEKDIPTLPNENQAMSEALLEDLKKQVDEEQTQEASLPATDKPQPTESASSLAETPLELEDAKHPADAGAMTTPAKEEPASSHTSGLLDTGELHRSLPGGSTAVAASHMLEAGDDQEQPIKVFDTKEYHTPIAPTSEKPKPKGNKVWEFAIIIMIIMIVVAAVGIAYMVLFKG